MVCTRVRARWQRCSLLDVVQLWRREGMTLRRLAKMRNIRSRRSLAQVLRVWLCVRDEALEVQQLSRRLQRQVERRLRNWMWHSTVAAFNAWLWGAPAQKRLTSTVSRAHRRLTRRVEGVVLNVWRHQGGTFSMRRKMQAVAEAFARRWLMRAQGATWAKWNHAIAEQKRWSHICGRIMGRLEQALVFSAWLRWREQVRDSRNFSTVVRHLRLRLAKSRSFSLALAMDAWVDASCSARAIAQTANQVGSRKKQNQIRATVRSWGSYSAACKHRRVGGSRLVARVSTALQYAVVGAWREMCRHVQQDHVVAEALDVSTVLASVSDAKKHSSTAKSAAQTLSSSTQAMLNALVSDTKGGLLKQMGQEFVDKDMNMLSEKSTLSMAELDASLEAVAVAVLDVVSREDERERRQGREKQELRERVRSMARQHEQHEHETERRHAFARQQISGWKKKAEECAARCQALEAEMHEVQAESDRRQVSARRQMSECKSLAEEYEARWKALQTELRTIEKARLDEQRMMKSRLQQAREDGREHQRKEHREVLRLNKAATRIKDRERDARGRRSFDLCRELVQHVRVIVEDLERLTSDETNLASLASANSGSRPLLGPPGESSLSPERMRNLGVGTPSAIVPHSGFQEHGPLSLEASAAGLQALFEQQDLEAHDVFARLRQPILDEPSACAPTPLPDTSNWLSAAGADDRIPPPSSPATSRRPISPDSHSSVSAREVRSLIVPNLLKSSGQLYLSTHNLDTDHPAGANPSRSPRTGSQNVPPMDMDEIPNDPSRNNSAPQPSGTRIGSGRSALSSTSPQAAAPADASTPVAAWKLKKTEPDKSMLSLSQLWWGTAADSDPQMSQTGRGSKLPRYQGHSTSPASDLCDSSRSPRRSCASFDSDDEDDDRQDSQLVPERLPLSHLLLSATMDATQSASGRDCLSHDIKAVRCHRRLSCAFVDPVSCIAPHRPGVQRLARRQTETRTDIRPRAQRLLRRMMTSSQTCWKNKCTPTSGVSTPVNRD